MPSSLPTDSWNAPNNVFDDVALPGSATQRLQHLHEHLRLHSPPVPAVASTGSTGLRSAGDPDPATCPVLAAALRAADTEFVGQWTVECDQRIVPPPTCALPCMTPCVTR